MGVVQLKNNYNVYQSTLVIQGYITYLVDLWSKPHDWDLWLEKRLKGQSPSGIQHVTDI